MELSVGAVMLHDFMESGTICFSGRITLVEDTYDIQGWIYIGISGGVSLPAYDYTLSTLDFFSHAFPMLIPKYKKTEEFILGGCQAQSFHMFTPNCSNGNGPMNLKK